MIIKNDLQQKNLILEKHLEKNQTLKKKTQVKVLYFLTQKFYYFASKMLLIPFIYYTMITNQ